MQDHNHHPVHQSPEYLGAALRKATLMAERAERRVLQLKDELLDLRDQGFITAEDFRLIESEAYYGMELRYIESTTNMEIKLGRR